MEEGHETGQDVVVAPSPGGLVMTAGEDVIPVDVVRPLAGATPIVGSQSTHGWQRQPHVHTEPDDDDVYDYIRWRLELEGETDYV